MSLRKPRPQLLAPDDIDAQVLWTLIQAGRYWEGRLTEVLAPHALTPVQFGVLSQLAARPSLTQAELARRVLMRPQSMNYLLDTMVERDLVRRSGERGSGRANPIELTAAGTAMLEVVWPVVQQVNSPAFLGFDPQHLAALNTELKKLLTRGA